MSVHAGSVDIVYDRYIAAEKLKHGTKFERVAAVVFQILNEGVEVRHDVRLRGDGKDTTHQIDVSVRGQEPRRHLVIECKDKDTAAVGLGTVRDFNGAVIQLDADAFLLASSRFTKAARTYANDERIQIGTMRPFTDEDWEGRIRKVVLTISAFVREDPPRVELQVTEGTDVSQVSAGLIHVSESPEIESGRTLHSLVEDLIGAWPMREGEYEASQSCDPPLTVGGTPVHRVVVRYRVTAVTTTVEVESDAVPELLIRTLDGTLDRVITSSDLKRFTFDESGKVIARATGGSDS